MTDEARIEETPTGRQAADAGWWVMNLAEMSWFTREGGGTGIWSLFEAPSAPSETLGIGVHVLEPGDVPSMYHAESDQEGFLVLHGECLLVVEGEERPMRRWDYFHCPPWTAHITLNASDGPCALLMVGTRSPDSTVHYPAEPAAAAHGAAVATPTDDSREAYAGAPPIVPAPSPWPVA
jgi:quercetin dioxygenase-like cupin family protein